MLTINLVFAAEDRLWQQTLSLAAGTTAQQALNQSQLYVDYPNAHSLPFGLFGERCQPSTVLHDGDRLEVYRPLVFDPMESRRRRAQHKQRNRSNT